MNTPLVEETTDAARADAERTAGTRRWPRSPMLIGAVAAALVAIAAAVVVDRVGGGDTVETAPLELSLGAPDVMTSCIPFDVSVLADMSPAFAGTAVAVEGDTVTLDVDRWYVGGDADQVRLRAASGMEALIDGFDVEIGRQYLITAARGTVNFCGYSGLATPELSAAFEQAFGG